MTVPVRNFLKARRDRVVGSIMGYCERNLFQKLTRDEQLALRSCILDSVDGYHDAVLDLMKSDDDLRNDRVVTLLEALNRHMEVKS